VDLARWKLADKADREFALTGKIPAGETLSLMLVNTQMVLANGGGPVKLIDADGGPARPSRTRGSRPAAGRSSCSATENSVELPGGRQDGVPPATAQSPPVSR